MPRTAPRPNRTAARKTVRALRAGGRLENVDAAAVTALLTSADLVDETMVDPDQPAYAKAQAIRAHLAALGALIGKDGSQGDDGISAVIAALSTPASYPENRST
jgi:hypothetical protein